MDSMEVAKSNDNSSKRFSCMAGKLGIIVYSFQGCYQPMLNRNTGKNEALQSMAFIQFLFS